MKKARTPNHKSSKKLISSLTLILIFLSVCVIYQSFYFRKSIPDMTELPKDVKQSIKDVKPQKNLEVPILLYHYVEYVKDPGDTIRKSLNILPPTFEVEIKTLKDAGYSFVTMADLANALDDRVTLSPKSVILTFDDGYRDFYTDVFPILKRQQVKATVFIVPNFLDKPNNMDTWMIKEIAQSGLVEIGAHTMNHTYLTSLPLKRVEYEVIQSKKYLEKLLGYRIVSFAYPYGAFDNTTIDVVKKAGFRSAVTTISGFFTQDLNRFFLYRIRPGGRVGESLLELLKF
ncbi:polysaccharide deacetylase family protein [Candidatus Daviesbacteria bacterium]|nr:polysaccharide deacetylase family protein [Candidatus Daviesbacteria bacterium]